MKDLKLRSETLRNLVLIGQLGLSLIMPLLLCFFGAYALTRWCGAGSWVYLPALILGLGASGVTAYRFYLDGKRREEEGAKPARKAYNKHI